MTFRVLPPLRRLELALDRAARALMGAAFGGDFSDADWAHADGGWRVVAMEGGALVGHAAVAPRALWVGGRRLGAGYVEAVAVAPAHQRRGVGAALMGRLHGLLDGFELGALSTGAAGFYVPLGWSPWLGPSGVREGAGVRWTPEEDGGLFVRPTPRTGPLDRSLALTCLPRDGDDW